MFLDGCVFVNTMFRLRYIGLHLEGDAHALIH